MISLFYYIFIIYFSLLIFVLYRYTGPTGNVRKSYYNSTIEFFFALIPVIVLTGFRYGIGTDYFSYEKIYNLLHKTPFSIYLIKHFGGIGDYYTEISWYILNRFFSFNFCSLLFVVQIIIFAFLYKGLKFFKKNINIPFAIMIYCFTQLIYSWNGMRFAVAVVILFSGFEYIVCRKPIKWIITVLFAITFHKTSVVCIFFYLLTEYNSKRFNKIRNFVLTLFVIFFPILIKSIFIAVGLIPLFSRYLAAAVYIIGDFHFSPMFLFHIIPVIVPLLLVRQNFMRHDTLSKILLRIYMLEIPFREIGMVNTWFTRFSRFPQMVEVVLVPYILYSLPKNKKKAYMYAYYFCWYAFYFIYYAVINDGGDSYPYHSILNF